MGNNASGGNSLGDNLEKKSGPAHCLIHVPSKDEKVPMMKSYDVHHGLTNMQNMLILAPDDATAIRCAKKSSLDGTLITSKEREDEVEKKVELFLERSDSSYTYHYLLWSRDGLPEKGNFAAIAHIDLPRNSDGNVDPSIYRKQVSSLSPTVVYNLITTNDERQEWDKLAMMLDIYPMQYLNLSDAQHIVEFHLSHPTPSPYPETPEERKELEKEAEKWREKAYMKLEALKKPNERKVCGSI